MVAENLSLCDDMIFHRSILILGIFQMVCCFASIAAMAHEEQVHLTRMDWYFDGFFGKFDRAAIQRGFQVYREVCSACHSIKRIRFADLSKVGFSVEEIKALAKQYEVSDGPNEEGQMFKRSALISDKIPSPYSNDNEARSANGGSLPPDLSLIIKARPDGANYVYSLLTGYTKTPSGMDVSDGQYYNAYFPGNKISMPPPLSDGQVVYEANGGHKATIEEMSKDVVYFLQWAAEPEMEDRKSMGLKVMLFLAIMTVIFYATMKQLWKDVE